MRTRTLRVALVILSVVAGLQSFIALGHSSVAISPNLGLIPQPIRQGPLQTTYALGGYYWFQIGAIGDSNSYSVDSANITIRTVYDQVRNDAHSYWVGTSLSTGGFVPQGDFNRLSTPAPTHCWSRLFQGLFH